MKGAAKLPKAGGVICFITSNTWMRTQSGEKLRDFFATQTQPAFFINLGEQGI